MSPVKKEITKVDFVNKLTFRPRQVFKRPERVTMKTQEREHNIRLIMPDEQWNRWHIAARKAGMPLRNLVVKIVNEKLQESEK